MPSYIPFINPGIVQGKSNTSEWEAQWDDLRFPANGITIAGLSTPPDVDAETGLLLFDGTDIETIAILAQFPHARKTSSEIRPHVHWRKTSDAAGGVVWTLRYKWFDNFETEPAWSGVISGTDAQDPGSTQTATITNFGSIAAQDENLSSLFLCQIGRLPTAAGDTYEADVLLYEFDIHYQIDTLGSELEFTK